MADDKTLTERIARAIAPESWEPTPESLRRFPEKWEAIETIKKYGKRQSLLDAERVLPIIREAERDAALAGAQSSIDFFADFNGTDGRDLQLQHELEHPSIRDSQ